MLPMKKNTFIFLLLLLFFACKAPENTEKDFSIKGFVSGCSETDAVLKYLRKGKLVSIDTVQTKNGAFLFKHVRIENPEMLWIVFDKGKFSLQLFADMHDMEINADYGRSGRLSVQGSKAHAEYVSFLENNSVYENKLLKVVEQKNLAYQNKDTTLAESLDSVSNNIYAEHINFIKEYAFENNKSVVSLYLTHSNLTNYIAFEELEKIFNNFDKELKSSPYYFELRDFIQAKKRLLKGKQAPDFSLPDNSGKLISLSALQGKYVLLGFSATWNEQCRVDNKLLKELYKKYEKKEFEIFQIFAEQNKKTLAKAIRKKAIPGLAVSDFKGVESDLFQLYAVRHLPQYFLLDKSGNIIVEEHDLQKITPTIKQLFSSK